MQIFFLIFILVDRNVIISSMSSLKKQKYIQKCKAEYFAEFSFIQKSRKGDNHVFCVECMSDISIGHGGRSDILNHVGTKKHLNNIAQKKTNNKINSFFTEKSDEMAVIRAECLFTSFIVEHNLPLSCADHVGNLLRKMFPGNEIAKKYGCARTKTRAIVSAFAAESQRKLFSSLKMQPFSLATDGSNDTDSKLYPMVVTYFKGETKKIENSLLALPVLKGDSTGLNIGNLMLQKLEQFDIPVSNCIAFSADNAAVMIGNKNGVAAVLKQQQPNLIIVGCLCHLLNLAAEKGAACLPLNVDELLIDVFYYLEKSSKRKEKLKEFQEFFNSETRKILKHVATRWLSTTKCLGRLISQWEPLVSFFNAQISCNNQKPKNLEFYKIPKKGMDKDEKVEQCRSKESKKRSVYSTDIVDSTKTKQFKGSSFVSKTSGLSREERLFYLLTCDINKAYCLFVLYINPLFDKLNVILQSQAPHIHRLRALLLELFKEALSKFVKVSVIKNTKDILTVDYHTITNQRNDNNLLIGEETMNVINKVKSEEREEFFSNIRQFYTKVCNYMVHKFPFKDDILLHAEVCNIRNFENASFSSIRFFLNKFPVLLKGKDFSEAIDHLQSSFYKLQMQEIPENIKKEERIDLQWVLIGQIKNEVDEHPFQNLAEVILGILSIPHSNAECERIFSKVKKNRTEFRSMLSDENLESLLIMKNNFSGNCYEQNLDQSFLSKAKSASTISNAM